MTPPLEVTEIRLTAAGRELQKTGLLGWVSCTLAGTLRVDGITLRRTADGRLALSFPARKDRNGVLHALVRPLDDGARRDIEAAILGQLGLGQLGQGAEAW